MRNHKKARNDSQSRRVSFPENECDLVSGYMEPANPWTIAENTGEVIDFYKSSCEKHGTEPLQIILDQLKDVNVTFERSASLDLSGQVLPTHSCESLEEILKRVQFKEINLEECNLNDESATALFDMIEYYEAATRLNVANNHNITLRGWQACSRMLKQCRSLEYLNICSCCMELSSIRSLSSSLGSSLHLKVLKLDSCELSGPCLTVLSNALKDNTSLRALHLGGNNLSPADMQSLAGFLRKNTTLQLLDLSSNNITDAGLMDLIAGIVDQNDVLSKDNGLKVLIVWNNNLTRTCTPLISKLLTSCRLEMLNIGENHLSDDFLCKVCSHLVENKYLQQLGMQNTDLTCDGMSFLSQIIENNSVLKRIDLRNNTIYEKGLEILSEALKDNLVITQIDIDEKGENEIQSLEYYLSLIAEIRSYCERNSKIIEPTEEIASDVPEGARSMRRLSAINHRKISLTCQTQLQTLQQSCSTDKKSPLPEIRRNASGRLRSPAPSPFPSPVVSPTRNRFQVSRVPEGSNCPQLASSLSVPPYNMHRSMSVSSTCCFPAYQGVSRFKVTPVQVQNTVETINDIIPVVSTAPSAVTVGFFVNSPLALETIKSGCDSEDLSILINKESVPIETCDLSNSVRIVSKSDCTPPFSQNVNTFDTEKNLNSFDSPTDAQDGVCSSIVDNSIKIKTDNELITENCTNCLTEVNTNSAPANSQNASLDDTQKLKMGFSAAASSCSNFFSEKCSSKSWEIMSQLSSKWNVDESPKEPDRSNATWHGLGPQQLSSKPSINKLLSLFTPLKYFPHQNTKTQECEPAHCKLQQTSCEDLSINNVQNTKSAPEQKILNPISNITESSSDLTNTDVPLSILKHLKTFKENISPDNTLRVGIKDTGSAASEQS